MATIGESAKVSVAKAKTPRLRKKGEVQPVVTPPAATPPAAPQAGTASSEAPDSTPAPKASAGKFKGLGTVPGIPAGLRRMEFQDRLLAWNEAPENRRTDVELAAIMDREHPGGVKIRPDHMRAIRRLYNEGKHTKSARVPEVLSVEYGPNKTPLAARARKSA